MRASHPQATVLLAVLVIVVAGCASGAGTSTSALGGTEDAMAPSTTTEDAVAADQHTAEPDDHASETFTFGEPADPAEADFTVQVRATDDMTFEPATVDIRAGEVITFEVENVGQLPHDFTLGDDTAQQEHAQEMADMEDEMAHTDPNTLTLQAGESGSVSWRFHDAGAVQYGCHQPGHYTAGMVGTVNVTP